ncbi:hypothetical protein HWV62_18864 [Athelia sp. TMB]|nr:hypothetical protein HWV62_18864 [Athelia sp. TMB]
MTTMQPDSDAPPPQPERSTPWFEDGNIVLETEGKQWKIYKGILAANSAVFRDMFDVAVGEGLVDGCPVVHLHDSAADLKWVLEALYEPEAQRWSDGGAGAHETMPIAVASAFLRLGRKYEIVHLRKRIAKRFVANFPTTLQDQDRIVQAAESVLAAFDHEVERGDLLALANVIRENELLLCLPFALYLCVLQDAHSTTSVFFAPPGTSTPILSLADIQRCAAAKESLRRLAALELFPWLHQDYKHFFCTRTWCTDAKTRLAGQLLYPLPPCSSFEQWHDSWADGLCARCAIDAHARYNKGRQAIWDQLPAMFGLPDWADLRRHWAE